MPRHITDEPDGINTAIITAAKTFRNILRSMWLQLKSKSNDWASSSRHRSKLIPAKVELCLFICNMFALPEDFIIPIEDFIIYGMGLFKDVKDTIETRHLIHDFIDDLITRGVIELCDEENEDDNKYFKVLPDGHKLAELIASKYQLEFGHEIKMGKWGMDDFYSRYYGLSLVFKKVKEHPVDLKCPKLVLLQLQYREDSENLPISFFRGMKKLRVLSLDVPSLPQALDVLRNLHTLRLKLRKSANMSAIKGLLNLEFLSISTSCLTVIPREMRKLSNLRLLDLRNTNLAYIAPGVLSRMLKLEDLYLPFSFTRWRCPDEHDDWESGDEIDYSVEEKINASICEINDSEEFGVSFDEIISLSLKVLQISLPNASILPKTSAILKNIQRFKILVQNNSKYEPLGEGQMNKLQFTGDACDIKESGICDLMRRTEDLSLIRVRNLKNIMCQLEIYDYSELKKVIVSECDELEYIVVTTKSWTPCDPFSELKSLHLSMLSNLKEIWHGTRSCFGWFENLRQISIRFCPKLKYVFPLSIARGLRQLKSINILDCDEMEGVFCIDERDDNANEVYFIEEVHLHSLGKLVGFVVEKDNRIDEVRDETNIQPLKTDKIVSTNTVGPISALDGNFRSFPTNEGKSKVSEICIEDEESINTSKSQSSVTQQLVSLKQFPLIKSEGTISHRGMYYAFLFKSAEEWLQNLKRLKIAFCDVVEVIFLFEENHATTGVFNSLIELELYGLRNLKHIWYQVPSEIMAFQNLQLLILSKCHNLYLCSSRVAKLLVQLQKVYISCCEKMEEIIAKEDEKEIKGTILFPRLKLLELQHMPELKIFYSGTYVIEFPLLESLRFNQCSKMKYFSNGWLRTPMLERIHINGSTYSLMRNVNATMEHYMDNCVGTPSNDANPRFTMRISYHPRAGPSKLTYNSTTTNLDDSAPTNSAWTSQISAAAGRILVAPDYVKNFTFSDLKIATRNFIPDLCLGEGCFGKVFKGWLDEKTFAPSKSRSTGMVVAIKRLEKPRVIGYRECQSELNFLGRVSHPNLVKLFGYCWEDKELLLVYEFMPRGSLENHLFRRNPGIEPLSWDLRLKIAIGAARGLAFLHTSEKKDIFRDFKASNILLDSNYNAKISDFGLAKLGPSGGDSHVTTRVLGAYGYAAPEYIATGHLYVKSDVYGFGVVLLELMTGLRALDTKRPNRQQNLADWLRPILSNKIKLKNTMDLRIEGQYSSKAMMLAAQLSSKCIESEPKSRPSMEEVLEALEQIDAVKEKPKGNKSSGFFNPKFSL